MALAGGRFLTSTTAPEMATKPRKGSEPDGPGMLTRAILPKGLRRERDDNAEDVDNTTVTRRAKATPDGQGVRPRARLNGGWCCSRRRVPVSVRWPGRGEKPPVQKGPGAPKASAVRRPSTYGTGRHQVAWPRKNLPGKNRQSLCPLCHPKTPVQKEAGSAHGVTLAAGARTQSKDRACQSPTKAMPRKAV